MTVTVADIHTLRLYDPPSLPTCWVVLDETTGDAWIVPALHDGWSQRRPWRGAPQSFRYMPTAPGYCYIGIGVPLRRDWAEVCRDQSGYN